MREGRYFPHAEAKRRTLVDLLDRYAREVLPDKKDRASQGAQLAWWRAELGALALADLTAAHIGEARDRLAMRVLDSKAKPEADKPTKPTGGRKPSKVKAAEPKRISPATVNRYLAALGHVLTVAVKGWGWLDDSPMRKVRKKHHLRRAGLALKPGKLTTEQRAECVRRAAKGEPHAIIARDFGVTAARVGGLARAAGLRRQRRTRDLARVQGA